MKLPFIWLLIPTILITLVLSLIAYIFAPAQLMAHILLSGMIAEGIVLGTYAHYALKDKNTPTASNTSLQDYCAYSVKLLGYASKE